VVTFAEQQQADLDAIYSTEEFAELITLDGVEVTALVGTPDATSERNLPIENVSLTASVRVSEVPSIARQASAVVRGVTYRVVGNPLNDTLEWQLNLSREMVTL